MNPDLIRGMTRRDELAWLLFRALARGDFHHDFGENVDTRDKIVAADENRFFEIAKLVSKKGSVWLRAQFKEKGIGKNLYTIIADKINTILPDLTVAASNSTAAAAIASVGVNPGKFASEDALLGMMGLDWVGLKRELATDKTGGVVFKKTFNVPGIDGGRDYEIRSCPYRKSLDRTSTDYKTNTAPIDALKKVTNGKPKFALIVDASGGFPLSDLRDRTLITGGGGGEVYIIENIENNADSATKLTNIAERPKLKPGEVTKLPPAPTLRFLRDRENTVNYPLWSNAGDQKSNIYSTFHIVLNRIKDDEVEANIFTRDASGKTIKSYSIGDVSNTSNVKNATLYAFATILENAGVTDDALVYTLIKRMGDWCQALSLLDLDRKYTVYEADGKTELAGGSQRGGRKEVTLREMQTDTEIGVVTNDRILLAFCLLLGLNVFYTSAMDIARLIYFKNTKDLPEGPALQARLDETLALIKDELAKSSSDAKDNIKKIYETRDSYITNVLNVSQLPEYILQLRSFLSSLGRLRLDVEELAKQAANYATTANDVRLPTMDRFNAANGLVSVLAKLKLDIAYNETTLNDIVSMASLENEERIRINALKQKLSSGGRIAKSVEVSEAKEILRRTQKDILQIIGKTPNLLAGASVLRSAFPEAGDPASRQFSNYAEILSVIPVLQTLLAPTGGAQTGGGAVDVPKAYELLRTRTIRVLPQDTPEATSTINVYKIGDSYYDESLKAYTVVDECVVTEDDLPVFEKLFQTIRNAPPSGAGNVTAVYLLVRYLLLRIDLALNDIGVIRQENLPVVDTPGSSDDRYPDGSVATTRIAMLTHLRMLIAKAISTLSPLDANTFFKLSQAVSIVHTTTLDGDTPVISSLDRLERELQRHAKVLGDVIAALSVNKSDTERAETAMHEKRLKSIVDAGIQDTQITETLAQKFYADLALNEVTVVSFGDAIRAAISKTILVNVDPEPPEKETPITIKEILEFPGFITSIQNAVAEWIEDNKGVSYRTKIPAIQAYTKTYIDGIQLRIDSMSFMPIAVNSITPAQLAASFMKPAPVVSPPADDDPELGGGSRLQLAGDVESNADIPRTGSARRGLYARLQQRAGEGTPPSV